MNLPAQTTVPSRPTNDANRDGRRGLSRNLFLALVAVAGILRFAAIGRQPLWLDEATDAAFGARPFWACVFAETVHPPLYRTLLHFFMLWFGSSAAVVRVLPAVFGLLAVPATAYLARRLFPQAELATVWLVAFSPFLIFFSQENRDYSLFILLAVVSTSLFLRFQESGRGLVLYTALSILLLYTHYLAVFVLLAHEIVYWGYSRREARSWIVARTCVAAAFAPWLLWALPRYQSESRLFVPPLLLIPSALLRFFLGYGVAAPDDFRKAQAVRTQIMQEAPVVAPSVCLFGWLLWRGARCALVERPTRALYAAMLIVPWAVLVGLAPWVQLTQERYLAFQAPFVLMLVAAGLCSLRGRARGFASAMLVAVIGFSLIAYYGAPGKLFGYRLRYGKENWAGVASFLRQQHVDTEIVAPGFLHLALDRYPRDGAREVEEPLGSSAVPELPGDRRVALVVSHAGPPEEQLRMHLDAAYKRVAQADFPSQNMIRVFIYDTSAGARASQP